ncbi:DUF4139 domain-containing protein [Chondromyces crocatus]|uniref:OmpA-like domain-containing protein n=1 Tax=Chondromyces crocatus TaxID=52 RepID=A0A0K1EBV8_CHOCO|nr:DUF4139 domain-containing protein [Chondromyces crocatus]AKT38371.1 uncharacterized protein CMC5_025170 [Chondromyces crocatus]
MRSLIAVSLLALVGCGSTTTYVASDTTLGRVVVYRNGIAYFERFARVQGDSLAMQVPADKVDDFLKSLTVVDAKTGEPTPIAYPTTPPGGEGDVQMKIQLPKGGAHELRLSYVTEAPSWKPSYRVVLGDGGKVRLQAWAIVDNTSGEDWKNVKLGVGASSALSFRYDLRSVRLVQRETLRQDDLFAQAPPTGGVTYGAGQAPLVAGAQRVVVEMSDVVIAAVDEEERAEVAQARPSGVPSRGPQAKPKPKASGAAARRDGGAGGLGRLQNQASNAGAMASMARNLQGTQNQIIVEGYADVRDGDKFSASLERANRVREQLIRNGLPPEQVVAVGSGEQQGRAGGVRVVEAAPSVGVDKNMELNGILDGSQRPVGGTSSEKAAAEPIGISHFESKTPMNVPRGTSAMISILDQQTEGEVVYFFDAESARGNARFPFRAVRVRNPTGSALETGPVTVFGEGRFIGEGLCEPIPERSVAFIPFALDRQVVVESKDQEEDRIARILTVQRGVFSTEVQHTRRRTYAFHNRLMTPATVYVRHTVAPGFTLGKAPAESERLGAAHLFRVSVPAGGKAEVSVEEATPVFKTADLRSTTGREMVGAFLSSGAVEGPLKEAVGELMRLQKEIGGFEQRVDTMREQMSEYRARMDELHAQIVTLRAVKTAGPLMQSLEKKLSEVSDKLSKATIELVAVQEKLMVARIRFQDGVADLSLSRKDEPAAKADSEPARPPSTRLGG